MASILFLLQQAFSFGRVLPPGSRFGAFHKLCNRDEDVQDARILMAVGGLGKLMVHFVGIASHEIVRARYT